jgi:hypothetical protein
VIVVSSWPQTAGRLLRLGRPSASRLTQTEARKLMEQSLAKAPHLNKAETPASDSEDPNDEAAA